MINTIFSNLTLTCTNQRKQRSRFFYHEAGDSSSRFNTVSPYTYNSLNQLTYSQNDFNMRRKAEILKYQREKDSNKKKNYAYLANKTKKNVVCVNKALPSSSSDVPGQVIPLIENQSVPLYSYKDEVKQFRFQNIAFDSFKRIFDQFPFFNVTANNGEYVNAIDIIILNPDNNSFRFNINVPVSIVFEADFIAPTSIYDVNVVQMSIFSATLNVFYSDTLIETKDVSFRSNPEQDSDIVRSTNSISIDLTDSVSGKIKCTKYIGNIIINDVTLQTVTQYVYSLFLKLNVSYAEFAGDSDDATRFNSNGASITNANSKNITNVNYSFITNFDNSDPTLFDSSTNSSITLFSDSGEIIELSEKIFVPFSVSATPI